MLNIDDVLDALDGIAYAIDADERIVGVGRRRWNNFATENGAPQLSAESVVSRNLFEFISGEDVREAYRLCTVKSSATREPVIVLSRCDSPSVARELRMTIAPLQLTSTVTGFLFHSQTISETVRPPLDIFDFKTLKAAFQAEAELPIVTVCSFCQRVCSSRSNDDREWITAEQYYRSGGDSRVRVSHGLCADCHQRHY
jgi:hypothetical protein